MLLCLMVINEHYILLMHNRMDGIKFIVSQARSIYQYNSLRTRILKCNADIFFNRQCLIKNIVPNYANISDHIKSCVYHTEEKRPKHVV